MPALSASTSRSCTSSSTQVEPVRFFPSLRSDVLLGLDLPPTPPTPFCPDPMDPSSIMKSYGLLYKIYRRIHKEIKLPLPRLEEQEPDDGSTVVDKVAFARRALERLISYYDFGETEIGLLFFKMLDDQFDLSTVRVLECPPSAYFSLSCQPPSSVASLTLSSTAAFLSVRSPTPSRMNRLELMCLLPNV